MPYCSIELRRLAQRSWRERRLAKGLCEKCPGARQPNKTTCAPCGSRESARRVGYQRRVLGAARRYSDGHGYRPRANQPAQRLAGCPTHCPRCEGFVVDLTIEIKCVNCGWIGWRQDAEVADARE